MKYCPECGAEYREGFVECSDCFVTLVDEPPDRTTVAQSEGAVPSLVCVYAADHVAADLIRSVLEGSGVPAIVKDEGSAAYRVNVGAMGEGRVMVRKQDQDRALEVIAAATHGDLKIEDA